MATINDLTNSMDNLTNNVHKANILDISKSFLPDNEIAINILRAKNKNMSRDEAQLMVGTYNKSKFKKSDFEPQYPLKNSFLSDEVKKIKHDVRYSAMMIVKQSTDLGKEVVNVTTMMVSSVAGITIMVAAPPYNVPAAITLLTNVINSIFAIINKVAEMIKFFPDLEKLALVVSPGALSVIIKTLKTAIDSTNVLYNILSVAEKFINTLIELLMSLIKKKTDTNKINKFMKKNDEANIDEPTSGLEFQSLFNRANAQALTINNNAKAAAGLTFSSNNIDSSHLYDVEFPDGHTKHNIGDSELDEIINKYNVVFRSIETTFPDSQTNFEFNPAEETRDSLILTSDRLQNNNLLFVGAVNDSILNTTNVVSVSSTNSTVSTNSNVLRVSSISGRWNANQL